MVWPFGGKKSAEPAPLNLDEDVKAHFESVVDRADSVAPVVREPTASAPRPQPWLRGGATLKTVKQVAMDNCVEYERAYSRCIAGGSLMERLSNCPAKETMYEECKNLQMDALEMLGFSKTADLERRKQIKIQADDLMIAAVPTLEIKASEAEEFKRLVEVAARSA